MKKCVICGKPASSFQDDIYDYCVECSVKATMNGLDNEKDFEPMTDTAEQALLTAAGERDAEASKKAFDGGEG